MATTRTFIALSVSPQVRRRAGDLVNRLAAAEARVNWVPADNLHLTLKFLGDQSDHQVATICHSVQKVAAGVGPFTFRCHGAGAFPQPDRPRTVWIGIDQGVDQLRQLHDVLEAELESQGFAPERRRYSPHLTVGRVRAGGPALAELGRLLGRQVDFPVGSVEADQLLVMASRLRRGGAEYEVLARAQLTGAGAAN